MQNVKLNNVAVYGCVNKNGTFNTWGCFKMVQITSQIVSLCVSTYVSLQILTAWVQFSCLSHFGAKVMRRASEIQHLKGFNGQHAIANKMSGLDDWTKIKHSWFNDGMMIYHDISWYTLHWSTALIYPGVGSTWSQSRSPWCEKKGCHPLQLASW